jgi:hypothetical protein
MRSNRRRSLEWAETLRQTGLSERVNGLKRNKSWGRNNVLADHGGPAGEEARWAPPRMRRMPIAPRSRRPLLLRAGALWLTGLASSRLQPTISKG